MKLQLVFDEQPRSTVRTNAPVEMVRALNNQGLKVDILFDEATHLSQSMKFSKAEKLLKTLLLLKPNDVDGLILLIKVLVAQKKWAEALSLTEEAKQKSISVPDSVSEFVQKGNERELKRSEIEKKKIIHNERAQLHQLKRELKRIRKEKNLLVEENNRFAIEIKNWIRASAIISGAALFLLIFIVDQLNTNSSKTITTNSVAITKTNNDTITPTVNKNIEDTGSNQEKLPENNTPQTENNTTQTEKNTREPEPQSAPPPAEPIATEPTIKSEDPNNSFYVVQPGDTLDKIAERFYGRKSKWRIIAEHNNVDPRRLKVGTKLEIPPKP
ncbi:MAG: hypothetical protein CMK59_11585 [Proteobacteria bacterium]|nr:hypothetical protein [Pseudomonadota bacterium]